MTSRGHFPDEPELLPPPELLRLRALLVRRPTAQVRANHLTAIAAAAREHGSTPAGRFASRTVRGAAAVVATLAITSGLAAAQVLPAPAQRIFSSVSDRFTPDPVAPPATAGATAGEPDPADPGSGGTGGATPPAAADEPSAPAVTDRPTTSTTARPSTTTTRPALPTTTTIPGPSGPGSPDGPTDPGSTDGGPTDPGSGGPTDPGSGEPTDPGTVGTTAVPPTVTTVPTQDAVTPTGGSG